MVPKDKKTAGEGATIFRDARAPAIEHMDSSLDAMGSVFGRAMKSRAPIVSKAKLDAKSSSQLLFYPWHPNSGDGTRNIQNLAGYWSDLFVATAITKHWINEFKQIAQQTRCRYFTNHEHYNVNSPTRPAMRAKAQYKKLLVLLCLALYNIWHNRQRGVQVLTALEKKVEAIQYTQADRPLNRLDWPYRNFPRLSCFRLCMPANRKSGTASQPAKVA